MALGLGCSARPGNAKNNKTGSWRVFKPNFNSEKCTKCGMCRMICPEGCISETEDEGFTPDLSYCKGCGLCAAECPVSGITMEQEEK
ncbi:MAG TPA: 4Fe-4S binding protein [Methanoregulaceae archaeon]|nr:4Fe-4S binding protein [Methanoregulaceae archaeon]